MSYYASDVGDSLSNSGKKKRNVILVHLLTVNFLGQEVPCHGNLFWDLFLETQCPATVLSALRWGGCLAGGRSRGPSVWPRARGWRRRRASTWRPPRSAEGVCSPRSVRSTPETSARIWNESDLSARWELGDGRLAYSKVEEIDVCLIHKFHKNKWVWVI